MEENVTVSRCADSSTYCGLCGASADDVIGRNLVARLSFRLLSILLRHSLDHSDGWRMLPLIHSLFRKLGNSSATCRHLLVLGCNVLAHVEFQIHQGELPFEPLNGGAIRTSTTESSATASPNLSTGDLPGSTNSVGNHPGSQCMPSAFWTNLGPFLHCLDELLLRSRNIWLAKDTGTMNIDDRSMDTLAASSIFPGAGLISGEGYWHTVRTCAICTVSKFSFLAKSHRNCALRSTPLSALLRHLQMISKWNGPANPGQHYEAHSCILRQILSTSA